MDSKKTKKCTACEFVKSVEEFPLVNLRGKQVLCAKCKPCFKIYKKIHNEKQYYKDPKKRQLLSREYYKTNKKSISKKRKKDRKNNKEREKEQQRKKYLKHRDKYLKRAKEKYLENKEQIKKSVKKTYNKRIKTNKVFKLKENISCLIHQSIKRKKFKKTSKTADILGCSILEFKHYIEKQFQSWMVWENHGKYDGTLNYGWDLDHIIPINSAKTEQEVISLNHYTNFQPLCSKINRDIKKGKF